MRNFPPAFAARLQSGLTTLVPCWRLQRTDGVVIRGTENTRDLTVTVTPEDPFDLSGVYSARRGMTASSVRSGSDLSPDNLEVSGALVADFSFNDLNAADIEAGLFDNADYVIFQVFFDDPGLGQNILRRGNLGNIKRDSDGRFTCELRGLTQRLAQSSGRVHSLTCDADLGDARCKKDLAPFTVVGMVSSIGSAREFSVSLDVASPDLASGFYAGGELTFGDGNNAGYTQEIKSETRTGLDLALTFFEPFARQVQVGDTVTLLPGCNKELTVTNGVASGDCVIKFDNAINHRGFPGKPGPDTLLRLRSGPVRKT